MSDGWVFDGPVTGPIVVGNVTTKDLPKTLWGIPVVVTTKDESPLGSKVNNRKSRRAAKAGKRAK